jgi:hypothetical protein
MSLSLFKLVDGNLVVNTIELLGIDSFRSIIKDNKTAKEHTFRELMYVWLLADNKSPINKLGKSGKEAVQMAIEKAGLSNDWKPSSSVKQALVDYKDFNSNIAEDVVSELLKVFGYYTKVVGKVRKSIENLLEGEALNKTQTIELVELMTTVITISKSIPHEVRNLNEALVEFQKNETKAEYDIMRGSDEEVPDSADPNRGW